jgi:hypothetical protein
VTPSAQTPSVQTPIEVRRYAWPPGRAAADLTLGTPREGGVYLRALILLECGGVPWGLLEMTAIGGIIRGDDGAGVASGRFVGHEMASARGPSEHGPSVRMRVVGPTCQNPWRDVRAVSALLRNLDPALELVVVETCRRGSSVAQVRAETCPGERRLECRAKPRPGVAYTRGRGAVDARDGLVVFVDDDVVVHPYCSTALRAPQNSGSSQSYGVLIGTLPPLTLECDAELLSFGEGPFENLVPGDVCRLGRARSGAGAVVAIPRDFASALCVPAPVLPRLGGFDARLGAGMPTRGGDDIDFVVRARALGYALRDALSAVVWREYPDSLRGVFGRIHAANGGLSAALTKHLLGGPHRLRHLQRASADVCPLTRSRTLRAPVRADAYPRTVPWAEALGDPAGPVGYQRSARWGRDR